MRDPSLVLLSLCVLLLLLMVVLMGALLWRTLLNNSDTSLVLLRDERIENQKLRNLLIAPDVPTLAGLQHVTLPSSEQPKADLGEELTPEDLGEAIAYEEQLIRNGYSIGDLGNDLESSGWSQPVTRRDGSDDPIAYDPT